MPEHLCKTALPLQNHSHFAFSAVNGSKGEEEGLLYMGVQTLEELSTCPPLSDALFCEELQNCIKPAGAAFAITTFQEERRQ